MISLAGLSAAYPGFQQAENTQATIQQNQNAAREGAIKLLAQQVLGRAFAGPVATPDAVRPMSPALGQPSMAPAPGQPSVPNQPAPAAPPPQQGGAPSAAPVPAAPAPTGPTGMPEISLQGLTQRILQTTPQVAQHPELLMAALERASPLLDRQSREDLAELRKQIATERLAQTGQLAHARLDALREAERGRQSRFDQREERLKGQAAVRQDQTWQRLEMQKQDMARKMQESGDKRSISQLRAIIDAQHKRAVEVIQANGIMSNLPEAERKQLLDEQNRVYNESISGLKGIGGAKPAPAPGAPSPAPAASAAAPAATTTPPIAALKSGTVTTFANGQSWTLGPDGQPQRVK